MLSTEFEQKFKLKQYVEANMLNIFEQNYVKLIYKQWTNQLITIHINIYIINKSNVFVIQNDCKYIIKYRVNPEHIENVAEINFTWKNF